MSTKCITPDDVQELKDRISMESEGILKTKKVLDDLWVAVDVLNYERLMWERDYHKLERQHKNEYVKIHIATMMVELDAALKNKKTNYLRKTIVENLIEKRCNELESELLRIAFELYGIKEE